MTRTNNNTIDNDTINAIIDAIDNEIVENNIRTLNDVALMLIDVSTTTFATNDAHNDACDTLNDMMLNTL